MSENDPDLNKLYNWDKDFVWHAFTQMAEYEPLLIERGEESTYSTQMAIVTSTDL